VGRLARAREEEEEEEEEKGSLVVIGAAPGGEKARTRRGVVHTRRSGLAAGATRL